MALYINQTDKLKAVKENQPAIMRLEYIMSRAKQVIQ